MENLFGKFKYWLLVKRTFTNEKRTEKFVKAFEQATGHKLTDQERKEMVIKLMSVSF